MDRVFLRIAVSLLVILLFQGTIAEENLFVARDLEVKLSMSNSLRVIPGSSDYFVDFVAANLSWYPVSDERQQVVSLVTDPKAHVGKNLEFVWNDPLEHEFSYRVDALIRTKSPGRRVHEKVPFPSEFPKELSSFVQPTETIDINRDISRKAAELAGGKDDLYEVVFSVGDWVKENVVYNLSTVTANAVQKSSWVYVNRQGVCDEITSLFISMLRSLGIPAKFVSGMSYTDLDVFAEKWGPHGWAEVYFPTLGWVPFDVTYRELGFLDATHIKLKESADSKGSSVEYLSRGRNVNLEAGQLDIHIDVNKVGASLPPLVEIHISPKFGEVGFGSYNLITAEVKNIQEYYVPADISLSRTKELELVEGKYQSSVLLKPLETKKMVWLVRVSESLSEGYTYTFNVEAKELFGSKGKTLFSANKHGTVHTYAEFRSSLPLEDVVQKTLFECTSEKVKYPLEEDMQIVCSVQNLEKKKKEYRVCVESCEKQEIPGSSSMNMTFAITKKKAGFNNIVATATCGDEKKQSFVLLQFLERPNITIENVTVPSTIGFNDEGAMQFMIRKNAESVAKNIRLSIGHPKLKKEWHFTDVDDPREFKILFYGNNLKAGKNEFHLIVEFEDEDGKAYKNSAVARIELVDLTFFQKVILFFDDLETKLFT
jgi:transglutaminase-like putative cysteine protease